MNRLIELTVVIIPVCQMVSNGTIAFITNAECDVLQSLSSLINDLKVPIISIGAECVDITQQADDFLLNFPPEKPEMTQVLTGVLEDMEWSDVLVVYGEEEGKWNNSRIHNKCISNIKYYITSSFGSI